MAGAAIIVGSFVVIAYEWYGIHKRINEIEVNTHVLIAYLATWSMRPEGKVTYPNVQEQAAHDTAQAGLIARYMNSKKGP